MQTLRRSRKLPCAIQSATLIINRAAPHTRLLPVTARRLYVDNRLLTDGPQYEEGGYDPETGTFKLNNPESYTGAHMKLLRRQRNEWSGIRDRAEQADPDAEDKNPPNIYYSDLVLNRKQYVGKKLVPKEQHAELYKSFEPHTGIVQPGPTDLPGKPTEVHILSRSPKSPPERVFNDIRRLVWNPCYVITTSQEKLPTVVSTELVNVELGFSSHQLPRAGPKEMILCYKNWRITEGGRGLEKVFRFATREFALKFMRGLETLIKVKIKNQFVVEHHPVYGITGRRVFIKWSTHEPSEGISSWDVSCAKQTDRWASACEVKDVLPDILEWKFETRWAKPNAPDTSSEALSTAVETPEATADESTGSKNMMNIIENLMQTTKELMEATEQPSRVQRILTEATQNLSKTIESIAEEQRAHAAAEEAKETEVLQWLESNEGSSATENGESAEAEKVASENAGEDTKAEVVEAEIIETEAIEAKTTEAENSEVENDEKLSIREGDTGAETVEAKNTEVVEAESTVEEIIEVSKAEITAKIDEQVIEESKLETTAVEGERSQENATKDTKV
ncbi:hypothetical protein ABW20_dc0100342 [Dactylellina cionopaga]|nr:hypothetical protein ABW20_dc0100342 [Dactylellina cionopaga]